MKHPCVHAEKTQKYTTHKTHRLTEHTCAHIHRTQGERNQGLFNDHTEHTEHMRMHTEHKARGNRGRTTATQAYRTHMHKCASAQKAKREETGTGLHYDHTEHTDIQKTHAHVLHWSPACTRGLCKRWPLAKEAILSLC